MTRAEDPQATIEALQRELDEKEATVEALQTQVAALSPTGTPSPSPTPTTAAKKTPTPDPSRSKTVITEFGQEGPILYLPRAWTVSFDPDVQVRTYIGDYSIVPRRGQFLVIWFYQTGSDETLTLGNFQLKVLEPNSDKVTNTYQLSKEGTAALILSEYDWLLNLMQSDLTYRTGIAFDIKPEDVHFRLQYRIPASEYSSDFVTWVDIEFRA
jgi:hypothetical protein